MWAGRSTRRWFAWTRFGPSPRTWPGSSCCGSSTRCRFLSLVWQRVPGEYPLFDGPTFLEMVLHKEGNALGGQPGVPSSFRVDDRDRSALADPQAADLGAVTGVWAH